MRVSPIGVDIVSDKRAGVITLTNTDTEEVSLQVRVFRWTQVNGEDKLEPAVDVFASPPNMKVAPGAAYTIRIARLDARPVGGESAYRMIIDELPKPQLPGAVAKGVKMLLRTSVPIFVVDRDAITDLTWSITKTPTGLEVHVDNKGGRHVKLSGVQLTRPGGQTIDLGTKLGGYVLARSERSFAISLEDKALASALADGELLTITAKGNSADIKGTARVSMPNKAQ